MYRKLVLSTIVSIYILILAGGIVRASGSGMGCPDWPKCFGLWIPPTNESQLPDNYKLIYSTQYHEVKEFNALKTWTEYINRIIGVIIGLLTLSTALLSIKLFKKDKWITILSFLSLLIVILEGWLGSVVVYYNLKPIIVTLHMLFAIVIVSILFVTYLRTINFNQQNLISLPKKLQNLLYLLIILSTIQVLLGTQVRQKVDVVSNYLSEKFYIEEIGLVFYLHRSLSSLVTVLLLIWIYKTYNHIKHIVLIRRSMALLVTSFIVVITAGIILNYLGFPQWAQPIHLTFGCIYIGLLIFVSLAILKLQTKNSFS